MFVQLTCYFFSLPVSLSLSLFPLFVASLSFSLSFRCVCVGFLCVQMICSACGFFLLLVFRIFCSFGVDRFALKLYESLKPKSAYGEKCLAAAVAACVQKIGFGRFFLMLVAYFYISSMLFLFDRMSGEDFNAFIIGCVYGFLFSSLLCLLVNEPGCLFIKQSSGSSNVIRQHGGVCTFAFSNGANKCDSSKSIY